MSKVTFLPNNVEFEIDSNQSVLELSQEKKIPIRFSCNGVPSCAECRIRIVEGEENVNPPSKKEVELIGNVSFVDSRRLACQLFCFGDVKVDLSDHLKESSAEEGSSDLQQEGTEKDSEKTSSANNKIQDTFALDEDE